jgi:MFS transporter, PCFT/HCP family, solute carrier family 46 (folate transporter), member 1
MGPWSDRNGRRPLLLLPALGFMSMYAGYLLLSLEFARECDPYYLLLASTPVAFSGNFCITILAAFNVLPLIA